MESKACATLCVINPSIAVKMKINLQKMIIGAILITSSVSVFAAPKFNSKKSISVLSREDGSGTRGAFIELFGIEKKDANGKKVDYTTDEAAITKSWATGDRPSFTAILNGRLILYEPLLMLATVASAPSIFTAFTESFNEPKET